VSIDNIVGYFTYRSFRNQPVGDPNDILFGEGELLLFITDDGAVTGTLAFPADAGATSKEMMDIVGTVSAWNPLSLHFTGTGRAGTGIADFVYEYDCRVAHEWDTADPPQRPALVGTVRRNQDHGTAKAGATASFIAVQRDFVEPRDIAGVALIPEVVQMLGGRTHRLRHTVWHSVRGDWRSAKMTDDDRARLKELGWFLTDPPINEQGALDLTNGAGEDFLYMHRRMIRMVHEVYAAAGQQPPTPWRALPAANAAQFAYKAAPAPGNPELNTFVLDPDNSGFMVPPPRADFMSQVGEQPFFRFNKTSRGLAPVIRVANNLRNPRVASQLTLGAYGSLIEFTVHNWMHMRWATLSRDPESGKPEVRPDYDIDPRWDVLSNDYLGDFHSSHVNPIFWRLHGWVDDCISVWFSAHEQSHPGHVKPKEVRGIPWFEPGPWVLKAEPFDWPGSDHAHEPPGHHDHGEHHGNGGHHGNSEVETLERVMAILKEVDERPDEQGPLADASGSPSATTTSRLPGFARFSVELAELSSA
jgi:hypothetical protein